MSSFRVFSGLLVCLSATNYTIADYTPPQFFEMVGGADLIVLGDVDAFQERTYRLKIDRVLAGKSQSPSIMVMKVQDWACSWRHAPYAIGNRVVVFLKKSDDWSKHLGMTVFAQMSAGCEGELPVEGSTVFCYSVSAPPEQCGTIGRHRDVYRANLGDLLSAIEGYRSLYGVRINFKTLYEKGMLADKIERFPGRRSVAAPLSELKAFANRSYLNRYLANSTEAAIERLGGKSFVLEAEKESVKKSEPREVIIKYRDAREAEESP